MLTAPSHSAPDTTSADVVPHDPALAPFEDTARIRVESYALGVVELSSTAVMHLAAPLGGFPAQREFVLLPAARQGLWWLQSLTDAGLTFLLADPFQQEAGYSVDVGDVEGSMLRLEQPSDAIGLVMVTLPSGDEVTATANYRAPLVFNLAAQLGLQVLNRNEAHDVRRPIDLAAYPPYTNGVPLL